MATFSEEELIVLVTIMEEQEEEKEKESLKRKWIHDAWKKRNSEGEFVTLYKELIDDEIKFAEYFRMTRHTFELLLSKIEHHIKKKDTRWRLSITPKERLAVTLRFLATGDSYKTISFSYRLGQSTVHTILNSTCRAIVACLMQETMPVPTEENWKEIATKFYELWNFPNCIGAIDGKHIPIKAPANTGTQYFNYKKTLSIVLLGIVDAEYNFVAVDIGSYERNSDGGIFSHSNFGKQLECGNLNVPQESSLPNSTKQAPFVLVGDEAFPLKSYLMRPYLGQQLDDPQKAIYNYPLSRAKRVVENTFGILAQKFRIYNRRIECCPENVDYFVLSTCILHNFIRKHDGKNVCTSNVDAPMASRSGATTNAGLQNLPLQSGNSARAAFEVRETLKQYFNKEGAVAWQNNST